VFACVFLCYTVFSDRTETKSENKIKIKKAYEIAANAKITGFTIFCADRIYFNAYFCINTIKNRLYSNPGGLLLFTLKGKLLRILNSQ